jgi:osmotically inducible lipoprotein OsmB
MKSKRSFALIASSLALAASVTGCGSLSHQDKTTIGGAAIGGVAGSVLSNGSALGTVGGAAVGGVVGHEVGKRK